MWGIHPRAWISLAVGILAELTTGGNYSFVSWSGALKAQQDYNDSEIELIASFGHVGQYLGIICGILTDLNGVRLSCFCGGILQATGYTLMYLTSNKTLEQLTPPEAQGFCLFLVTFGIGFIYISCVRSNMHAFPVSSRGAITGLMTGMFAFSSSVITGCFYGPFGSSLKDFQLFMAILSFSMAAVASLLLYPIDLDPFGTSEPFLGGGSKQTVTCTNQTRRVVDVFLNKVRTFEFWILFASYFLGTGTAFVHINNSELIIKSLNDGTMSNRIFVATTTVFSILTGIGALSVGISDHVPIKRGIFYTLGLGILSVSHFIAAFALKSGSFAALYIVTAMMGLGYGIVLAIALTILSEIWTTDNLGQNWAWLTIASISSSFVFDAITKVLYGQQKNSNPDGEELECVGGHCFRSSFYFGAGMALLGAIISVIIISKTEARKKTKGFDTVISSFTELDVRPSIHHNV